MTITELTDLKTTINWLLENGEFKDTETSYNLAMNAVDVLEKQLSIPLVSVPKGTLPIADVELKLQQFRDKHLEGWSEPFHFNAETWAGMKQFLKWLEYQGNAH